MPSLFISRDAVSVRLRSERLELTRRTSPENGSQESLSVPLFDVERVVVCGRPAVTFPVLHELLKRKIPVILLSSRGRWLGVMDPGTCDATGAVFYLKMGCNRLMHNKKLSF